jgi:ABC-type antimicrobial peptide transport system permease subunit
MPARRVLTATLTGFAALALVLGAVGLFGLIAHDVASRRIELALRIALGADPARIIWTTVGHGAVTLASGLSLGALLSLWAVRALGVSGLAAEPFGVLGFAPAAMALVLAAAGAIVPVALRAARTDPLIVLRSE